MPAAAPTTLRSTLTRVGSGVEVKIPARTNAVTMVFNALWLCAWAYGEAIGIRALLQPPPDAEWTSFAFIGIWLLFWTGAGLWVMFLLAWFLGGSERLRFTRDGVSLELDVFGRSVRSRLFAPRNVGKLRRVEPPTGPFGLPKRKRLPWQGGRLAFDSGARTISFGSGVDAAEADYLLDKIKAAATWLTAEPRS
jgi:hypothetical protein